MKPDLQRNITTINTPPATTTTAHSGVQEWTLTTENIRDEAIGLRRLRMVLKRRDHVVDRGRRREGAGEKVAVKWSDTRDAL